MRGAHHKVAQLVAADQHLRGGLLQDLRAARRPSARQSHRKRAAGAPGPPANLVPARPHAHLRPLLLGERAVIFAQPDLALPAEEQKEMNLRGAGVRRGGVCRALVSAGRGAPGLVPGTPPALRVGRPDSARLRRKRTMAPHGRTGNAGQSLTGCSVAHAVLPITTRLCAFPGAPISKFGKRAGDGPRGC